VDLAHLVASKWPGAEAVGSGRVFFSVDLCLRLRLCLCNSYVKLSHLPESCELFLES
jgi:hypothetical protein